MGYSIAAAALRAGHAVTLISGPTHLDPPAGAELRAVQSTCQMYEAALECFDRCDGVIAAAAPADYRPQQRIAGKMKKRAETLALALVPNPDILAELGRRRKRQWLVGFALESHDPIRAARAKLEAKGVDLIVANTPRAMGSETTEVTVLSRSPEPVAVLCGPKTHVAERLIAIVTDRFAVSAAQSDGLA